MKLIVLALFLVGCSYFDKDNKSQPATGLRLPELADKAALYNSMSGQVLDSDGWILTDECDALLHNGLAVNGGGVDYSNLIKARDGDGRWFRRPAKDCLSSGSSKSSISRDMFLGLMLAIAEARDEGAINELVEYAVENTWVMGEHNGSLDGRSRVLLSPTFYKLMTDLRFYLSGSIIGISERERSYAAVDFTDHLDVLSMILRGKMAGGISDADLRVIKGLVEADPNNALYNAVQAKYTDGNQDVAINILLSEEIFPAFRLPTERDRRVPYLWMHGEKPKDWDGIDSDRIHPGHDLTFVYWVIND